MKMHRIRGLPRMEIQNGDVLVTAEVISPLF